MESIYLKNPTLIYCIYNSLTYGCVYIHIYIKPGLVAHTCNLRIWEAEAEWFPKVRGQPGLQLRPCLKKQGNSPPKATDTKDLLKAV